MHTHAQNSNAAAPVAAAHTTIDSAAGGIEEPESIVKTGLTIPKIQMQGGEKKSQPNGGPNFNDAAFRKMMNEWIITDKILSPMAHALAKAYTEDPRYKATARPDVVVKDTPYGGDRIIKGYTPPDAQRVFYAIYPRMNLKKIGKGNSINDWTFSWRDAAQHTHAKTDGEKGMDMIKWVADEAGDNVVDAAIKSESAIAKAAIKTTIEFVLDRGMVTTLIFATGLGEVLGTAMFIWGFLELLTGFGEEVEEELSPYEEQSEGIVAGVKAFLARKQANNELERRLKKPFKPNLPEMKKDRLSQDNKYPMPYFIRQNASSGQE